MKLRNLLCLLTVQLLFVVSPSMANVLFEKNQIEIVVAPTCNHAPISFPYTSTDAPVSYTHLTLPTNREV